MLFTNGQYLILKDLCNGDNDEIFQLLISDKVKKGTPLDWEEVALKLLHKIKEPTKNSDWVVGCIMLDDSEKLITFLEDSEFK